MSNQTSIVVLAASVMIALASWSTGFEHWGQMLEVRNVTSLLGVIGSVVCAWLGKSPLGGAKP